MKALPSLVILLSMLAVAVILPLMAEQSKSPSQRAGAPRIGLVLHPDDFDGYGCRLQWPDDYWKSNARNFFVSNAEEEAIMNIDGVDLRMYRIGFDAGGSIKGSHSVDRYRKDEIEVHVDFVITKRCSPDDENCEVTLFDAVVTVMRGLSKRTIKTKGICGS